MEVCVFMAEIGSALNIVEEQQPRRRCMPR
jgi:hypothetical protein